MPISHEHCQITHKDEEFFHKDLTGPRIQLCGDIVPARNVQGPEFDPWNQNKTKANRKTHLHKDLTNQSGLDRGYSPLLLPA